MFIIFLNFCIYRNLGYGQLKQIGLERGMHVGAQVVDPQFLDDGGYIHAVSYCPLYYPN